MVFVHLEHCLQGQTYASENCHLPKPGTLTVKPEFMWKCLTRVIRHQRQTVQHSTSVYRIFYLNTQRPHPTFNICISNILPKYPKTPIPKTSRLHTMIFASGAKVSCCCCLLQCCIWFQLLALLLLAVYHNGSHYFHNSYHYC